MKETAKMAARDASRMLLGVMIGTLSFLGWHAWFTSRVPPPPVEILNVQLAHPIEPGKRVTVRFTALVRRRCAATASLSIIAANGERIWVHRAPNVGYTEPSDAVRVIVISPPVGMPPDLAPGEYTLVYNRTDQCPDRTYTHEPKTFPVTVP